MSIVVETAANLEVLDKVMLPIEMLVRCRMCQYSVIVDK
jgi:hypothetical protein